MPIWGDAFLRAEGTGNEAQVREKIVNLVHYIWSIQEPA
jgi:hypothetical protein